MSLFDKLAPEEQQKTTPQKPAKKQAKSKDPNYLKKTLYLPKEIANKAEVMLIEQGKSRDFSELVGDLLSDWVNESQTK